MKKYYDFIFSLGAACSCTQSLRASGLQMFSYPFDWLYGSDFTGRVDILLSKFSHIIEKEDLENLNIYNGDPKNPCDLYHNSFNGITFNHDFAHKIPLDVTYDKVREKYERRIARLLNSIERANKILIVYLEIPNEKNKLENNDVLINAMQKFKEKYPDKNFELLYFTQNSDLKFLKYKEEQVADNIIKVIGNYKEVKENAPEYAVVPKFFKKYYRKYSLKTTVKYKIKRAITKFCIKMIPIKSIRWSLKEKYHVI